MESIPESRAYALISATSGEKSLPNYADALRSAKRLYWVRFSSKKPEEISARLAVEKDPTILGQLLAISLGTGLVTESCTARAAALGGPAGAAAVRDPSCPLPAVIDFLRHLAPASKSMGDFELGRFIGEIGSRHKGAIPFLLRDLSPDVLAMVTVSNTQLCSDLAEPWSKESFASMAAALLALHPGRLDAALKAAKVWGAAKGIYSYPAEALPLPLSFLRDCGLSPDDVAAELDLSPAQEVALESIWKSSPGMGSDAVLLCGEIASSPLRQLKGQPPVSASGEQTEAASPSMGA